MSSEPAEPASRRGVVLREHVAKAVQRGRDEVYALFWQNVCERRADNLEANALRAESFPDFKPEWAAARREEAEQLREWADEAMS